MSPIDTELTRSNRERIYHNELSRTIDLVKVDVEKFFTAFTSLENQAVLEFLGPDLSGKRVLDLGCGYGEASAFFAKRGAAVFGIDVSDGMIDLAQKLAADNGVAPVFSVQGAERLDFEDGFFDVVYGNGILHHIDLERSLPEIKRVLKIGGKAAFVEPLPYNPAINIYRKMATKHRTLDEKPLSMGQIRQVMNQFRQSAHREYWLTALLAFVYIYAIEGVHPNQEKYWKKIIYDAEKYRTICRPLFALDRLLTRLPPVRWLSWNTVLTLTK